MFAIRHRLLALTTAVLTFGTLLAPDLASASIPHPSSDHLTSCLPQDRPGASFEPVSTAEKSVYPLVILVTPDGLVLSCGNDPVNNSDPTGLVFGEQSPGTAWQTRLVPYERASPYYYGTTWWESSLAGVANVGVFVGNTFWGASQTGIDTFSIQPNDPIAPYLMLSVTGPAIQLERGVAVVASEAGLAVRATAVGKWTTQQATHLGAFVGQQLNGMRSWTKGMAAEVRVFSPSTPGVSANTRSGAVLNPLAAKEVGSGPAKGFLEVSDAYASSKAVQNLGSARPTDFIFDAQSQRFIMGRGPLGHDSVLQAGRIAPSETTVGGRIFGQDGRLNTDEWSGHYGQNWTPELRQQFQNFMQQHGVGITHTPWGQ